MFILKSEQLGVYNTSDYFELNAIDVLSLSVDRELLVNKINATVLQQLYQNYKHATLISGKLSEYSMNWLIDKAYEISLTGFIFIHLDTHEKYCVHFKSGEVYHSDKLIYSEKHTVDITEIIDHAESATGTVLVRTGVIDEYEDLLFHADNATENSMEIYRDLYTSLGEILLEHDNVKQVFLFDMNNKPIYFSVSEEMFPYVYPATYLIYKRQVGSIKDTDEISVLHATDTDFYHIYKHLDIVVMFLADQVYTKQEIEEILINI